MKIVRLVLGLIALGAPEVALATETITYTYDHQGRLTNVARAGSINNGVNAKYWYDNANNRTRLKVTGASSSPSRRPVKPNS